ncbi:CHY zinc finger protein [Halobacillus ihumii]|uniref:CHY zinc finger protein n=1 Tax=Halobacillus ihumii TaxID=2686092 RepID=UPI0013D6F6C2|nr:CHY zinc finger protein [Halobacillus ihumii]
MCKHHPFVKGVNVDQHTKCAHYHTDVDIIAIKFYCCNDYYACYFCHQEVSNHNVSKWPKSRWSERAILCGSCKHELTISEYMASTNCPHCESRFNEKCSNHFHLYFEMTEPPSDTTCHS